jgi:hypothetical protein
LEKMEELEIRKWTGFARITEMEFGDNFGGIMRINKSMRRTTINHTRKR